MQEQELYWTREAAKERGEMPATRPSGGSRTGLVEVARYVVK
jgi:hypothetical protein